jgi:hypothetical protein
MTEDDELVRDALMEYAQMLENKARSRSNAGAQYREVREAWRETARRAREIALRYLMLP